MDRVQARRCLRRTRGSLNLRGTPINEVFDSLSQLDWEDRPVSIRRMSSTTSIVQIDGMLDEAPSCLFSQVEADHIIKLNPSRQHQHKDSAVVIEDNESWHTARSVLPSASTCFSKPYTRQSTASTVLPDQTGHDEDISAASTIRSTPQLPAGHANDCCCQACRRIRHQRRKLTLKLRDRFETCQQVATLMLDSDKVLPDSKHVVWTNHLVLKRLFNEYERLNDEEAIKIADENHFTHIYMAHFNAVINRIDLEKSHYKHVFDNHVSFNTACVAHTSLPQVIDIKGHSCSVEYREASRIDSHKSCEFI